MIIFTRFQLYFYLCISRSSHWERLIPALRKMAVALESPASVNLRWPMDADINMLGCFNIVLQFLSLMSTHFPSI